MKMPAAAAKKRKSGTATTSKNVKGSKTSKSDEEAFDGQSNYKAIIKKCSEVDKEESGGGLLLSGLIVWELCRGKVATEQMDETCLWVPHRIGGLNNVKISKIVSHCSSAHSILLSDNGEVFTFGRNLIGQLGFGTEGKGTDKFLPVKLEPRNFDNEKIVHAATGKNHSVFVSENGITFVCGDNANGQLGVGSAVFKCTKPRKMNFSPKVKLAACGAQFTMLVDENGYLYSCGLPEFGQLGNGTDGRTIGPKKQFVFENVHTPARVADFLLKGDTPKDTGFVEDVKIKNIACGNNHTIACDTHNRVFTWGNGTYGRLGHDNTKDELKPRMVLLFSRFNPCEITGVQAGSTFSLVYMGHKMTYLAGQTRMSANAADMYFKPVMDLGGWNVTSVGAANKSIVVVGEGKVISWGPSPTYGELALGDGKGSVGPFGKGGQKSSNVPMLVSSMEGMKTKSVTCGHSHTLFLLDLESSEEAAGGDEKKSPCREKFEQTPVFMGTESIAE